MCQSTEPKFENCQEIYAIWIDHIKIASKRDWRNKIHEKWIETKISCNKRWSYSNWLPQNELEELECMKNGLMEHYVVAWHLYNTKQS